MIGKPKENDYICPSVSAKSWAILSGDTGDVIYGKNEGDRREIASLTKIMTCYTVLNIAKRLDIRLQDTAIEVSKQAATINGTRAEFYNGDRLTAWDLLHGMMLPSGNDAAICLAEYFGQVLFRAMNPQLFKGSLIIAKYPIKWFLAEMNVNAKMIGMDHTSFANPHGLANRNNKSTAEDLGKLCAVAMKVPKFRQVVGCKEYKCEGLNAKGEKKTFRWLNTHKLLWEGFSGIKTGITPHAGPCLASLYEKNKMNFIVILLQSKSMEDRWTETKSLIKWAANKLYGIMI